MAWRPGPPPAVAVALVAVAMLAACTTLDDVERDVCGNGVVEPDRGEDCDRDDATCGAPGTAAACQLLCGPGIAGEPACPAGGVCGLDGVCRAPSGRFDPTLSGAWTSRHLLVADTTGDGYPELIGVGDNLIELRLGGGDGRFDRGAALPNLPVFDVPRTGDLDGDGVADVVVPIGLGLYTLVGDPLTNLRPILQDSFTLDTDGPMIMTSFRWTAGGPSSPPMTETLVAMRIRQGPSCGAAGGCDVLLLGDAAVPLPPGRRVEHIVGDQIPWAPRSSGTDSDLVAALAFADDPATPLVDESGVFAYTGDAVAGTLTLLGQITGLPGPVRRGAWLADLDRDFHADLLVSVDSPAFGPAVMVAWGRAGGFDAPAYLIGGPGPKLVASEPLTWADLDRDAAADLIAESGIYRTSCVLRACTFFPATGQDRSWSGAAAADLNGDGKTDVAAFTRGGAIVDVLLGTGDLDFWNEAPLAAPGEISRMLAGDFDGNGVSDLAFATAPFAVTGADEIQVAYGRRNEPPSPPVFQGFVGRLVTMADAQAPLPGRADTIDDLLVVSERAAGRGIAIALGSTSKRLIAPLLPGTGGGGFALVEATLVLPLDDDGHDDVICLLTEFASDGTSPASRARVYFSDAAGTLTERTPAAGLPLDASGFALRGATWAVIPGRGGSPAIIVGSDIIGRTIAVSLTCDASTCTTGAPTALLTGAEIGEPTSLHAVDLDGDGDDDLVGTFRPVDGRPGGALIWHQDASGFGSAQVLTPPDGLMLADAAAIDVALDGRRALLLLARGEREAGAGVLLAERTDAGVYASPRADARFDLAQAGQGLTLFAGDVTGDGLEDVVLVSGIDRASPRTIAVFTHRPEPGALAPR